jgi:hypothetical protein
MTYDVQTSPRWVSGGWRSSVREPPAISRRTANVGQDLSWQFAAGEFQNRQDRSWPTFARQVKGLALDRFPAQTSQFVVNS